LAAEQQRIKAERTKVEKWAAAASYTANEFREVIDEALKLLKDPAAAYLRATPAERRMFNQVIFEKLFVINGDVVAALPNPWIRDFEALAGRSEPSVEEGEESPLTRALARHEAQKRRDPRQAGGLGLNVHQMVRLRGLEPPRPCEHSDLNAACIPISPQPRGRSIVATDGRRGGAAAAQRMRIGVRSTTCLPWVTTSVYWPGPGARRRTCSATSRAVPVSVARCSAARRLRPW
jgi:hypothetical protein